MFQRLYRRLQLKRWRKQLSLPAHAKVFHALYQDIDGFALSREARNQKDALEYVYGEILFEPFIALLSLCKPSEKDIFYDLGSGTGKAVLAAAMVFKLQRSCGIELFPELQRASLSQKKHLAAMPDYAQAAAAISFLQGNFLKTSFSDASIVFINATAFFGDYWTTICQYLEKELRPGTWVLSSSKPLIYEGFFVIHATEIEMSWGPVSVYLQKRAL